jgi:SAM-dependent MidA family methyltransferase
MPVPDRHALEVSARLTERIRQDLARAGGWMSFAEYMRRVLYEPGLGYYSAGSAKFGRDGDFVTAPEIGPLFGRALAGWIGRLLSGQAAPVVVELGAGTGRLAKDILGAGAAERQPSPAYRIFEPSAELRARQKGLLADFGERVQWLDRWPCESFEGVVLANEVLDALPVSCFVKRRGAVKARGVGWRDGRFVWREREAGDALRGAVEAIEEQLGAPFPDDYLSEVRLGLPAWIESVAEPLSKGYVLLIDYGAVRREYYHRDRRAGWLVCHYRHRAHEDPFLYPGLQDISAWVDFTACADAALAAGMSINGFTTQAQFVLGSGVARLPASTTDREALRQAQALKTLVLPGEMGERFKFLLLGRSAGRAGLPGRDFRDRL